MPTVHDRPPFRTRAWERPAFGCIALVFAATVAALAGFVLAWSRVPMR